MVFWWAANDSRDWYQIGRGGVSVVFKILLNPESGYSEARARLDKGLGLITRSMIMDWMGCAVLIADMPVKFSPSIQGGGYRVAGSVVDPNNFQPMNINFGLFPPLEQPIRDKKVRRQKIVERGLKNLESWIKNKL